MLQDSYEDLVLIVASRRSGLNQNLAQKEQYERALQDLTDLLDTAKDKMSADGRVLAGSVEDIQTLLDKHKALPAPLSPLNTCSFQPSLTPVVCSRSSFRVWRPTWF